MRKVACSQFSYDERLPAPPWHLHGEYATWKCDECGQLYLFKREQTVSNDMVPEPGYRYDPVNGRLQIVEW